MTATRQTMQVKNCNEALMKYMLLVRHDERVLDNLSEAERQEILEESVQLARQLHTEGRYLHAAPLRESAKATNIRIREGKTLVTDGPFAETREQVLGYFLIDVGSLDEAIGIAARIPGARIGTIELRQIAEVTGLPEIRA
jgi:hypothetical protein